MQAPHRLSASIRRLLYSTLLVCLAGCSNLSGSRIVNVGEREVELALLGNGRPTVIFENGLDGRMQWWGDVVPEVSKRTTTLAYNRAGYGDSSVRTGARDGEQIVSELQNLLQQLDLPPPYVLVGHSLGGLYMQLFARRYPEQTAALVLVDSTHPLQLEGAGAPAQWPLWLQVVFDWITSDTAKQEFSALEQSGQQVLALPNLTHQPVWILSAAQPLSEHSPLADDGNQKRRDLVRLYPGATQWWIDSGHAIPLEQPEAIIEAVTQAITPLKERVYPQTRLSPSP